MDKSFSMPDCRVSSEEFAEACVLLSKAWFEATKVAYNAKESENSLMQERLLKEQEIRKAESALAKGDRVELIPVKDGVNVVRIRREEVKK